MNNYRNILVERDESVATIILNRPEVRNALDVTTREELLKALEDLSQDNKIRVVIFTGAGDKSFISGADIRSFVGVTPTEIAERAYTTGGMGLYKKIEGLDKPTIAAVNGYALGGGCELAMCCDIRIASSNARFGQTEINIGIMPGGGGTQRLPRLVGAAKAKEMCFTGEIIDANEAYRIGLVNRVVPVDQLRGVAMEMAKKIASKSPLALKYIKRSINFSMQTGLDSGLAYETQSFVTSFSSEDKEEGVAAFLEKRTPVFKGK